MDAGLLRRYSKKQTLDMNDPTQTNAKPLMRMLLVKNLIKCLMAWIALGSIACTTSPSTPVTPTEANPVSVELTAPTSSDVTTNALGGSSALTSPLALTKPSSPANPVADRTAQSMVTKAQKAQHSGHLHASKAENASEAENTEVLEEGGDVLESPLEESYDENGSDVSIEIEEEVLEHTITQDQLSQLLKNSESREGKTIFEGFIETPLPLLLEKHSDDAREVQLFPLEPVDIVRMTLKNDNKNKKEEHAKMSEEDEASHPGLIDIQQESLLSLIDESDPSMEPQNFEKKSIEEKSEEVIYDIPIVMNKRVEQLMDLYLNKRRKVLELGLRRSGQYLPMMQSILKEKGLPLDLAYLVAVESNYNTKARSQSHAVGLWQFIASTGRNHGLQINQWVDDRMDPIKATYAAANYLSTLYHEFNDWELSLAAYNSGEGRVRRAVKKAQMQGLPADFWSIHLPRETRNYVPAMMAVTIISKNLKKYDLDSIGTQDPMIEDKFTLPTKFPLQEIASRSGISFKELLELNPSLYRGLPPFQQEEYSLYLPEKYHEPLLASLESKPEPEEKWHGAYAVFLDKSDRMTRILEKEGEPLYFRVRQGDTLWDLSGRYHTTVVRIRTWNGLSQNSVLSVGQRLKVYIPTWKVFAKAAEMTPSQQLNFPQKRSYVINVSLGDSLSGLARRYGTTVSQLMDWNSLEKPTDLQAGQRLIVGELATLSEEVTPSSIEAKYHVIRVLRGETLSRLAKRYNTTVKQIQLWNDLKQASDLRADQKLIVGKVSHAKASKKTGKHHVILVKEGDTLWSIAKLYGTSVQQLIALNNISSSQPLKLNQKLLVPVKDS
ncbi:LysM peptidoglycan-binding domain-containing protein [Deltaproteobacteria bacterium TL4]